MKQRLGIFILLILIVGLLVGLNAAAYQQKEKTPDSELRANRSSFNSGATGTQAWFTLLAESGRKVTRWQDAPASLLTSKTPPSVFVIVGFPREDISDKEVETLLSWTARGGRLVLIYRELPDQLAVTTADWKIGVHMPPTRDIFSIDPADQQQMTNGVAAIKPSQPSIFTQGVNAIQPSRFAQGITLEANGPDAAKKTNHEYDPGMYSGVPPATVQPPAASAPVVHYADSGKNLVVEVPYKSGSIVIVSDPYIVSNGGIALADNARFATDLVVGSGTVAFDEYHQGYRKDSDRFLLFFAGTPIVAIFLQAAVLIGLVFYSQSRRFARAIPEAEPDRLSKLEYVAAMAELQQRTRAWDLAMENIYNEFRRRTARLFGLDVREATCDVLAKRVSERIDVDVRATYDTLFKCEEIIRGEGTNKTEVVRLTDAIRDLERKLGLRRGRATK